MVLSTALFDKPAFKNLICNGLVLAEDGRKMSKRLKNYPDPQHILASYGADALRLYLINSPVVRAEDLRFQELGVKQVVKDVFIPWYHAYRLFVQSANTRERLTGTAFVRDAKRALASTSIMDRWILAAAHSLLRFMRQEMELYRLFTVVPKLVVMIDQLTNWYLRLNKERLSGDRGPDEQLSALCATYEVLMMMCTMMAPLTPFFTEEVYRNLSAALPASERLDSVHFCEIPQYDPSAIDEQIEADMAIMQQVIEKCRGIRDRHANLSLRTPLPEVTLVHQNPAALEAVKRLQSYIADELNVRAVSVALVADVPELVRFKCLPNHTVLGKRFGKEYKKVQDAIKGLGHESLAGYMAKGTMELDGHTFSGDDIVVSLEYAGATDVCDTDSMGDGAGLIVLNIKPTKPMLDEAMAREVCAKVQKMRKEAGLQKSDEVEVGFASSAGADSPLSAVLHTMHTYISSRIGKPLLGSSQLPTLAVPLATKAEEVKLLTLVDGKIEVVKETLTITLCRGCVFMHPAKLATLAKDPVVADGVNMLLHSMDLDRLKASLAASKGAFVTTLDGQKLQLQLGTHFFLNSAEALNAGAI
mmetsp:Transcript_53428/g.138158  ORF Transcript_53428/g.138158 Transcript_53428/m.138158 type:complete len:588 (-) Transcript_53428:341-2104(-)